MKKVKGLFEAIINDTLKKKGKWSRTSLTMFSAWMIAIFMALYSLYKTGFDYTVFLTFVGIATGMKIIDVVDSKEKKDEKPKDEINA